MRKDRKIQIEENKKNFSIKSMYFNRYLLVRYIIALFFFTNIYWLISLLMSSSLLFFIPLSLMLILLSSVAEQIKILNNHTNQAANTKYCFTVLLITNVLLMFLSSFSTTFTHLYPFLINQMKSQILVLSILAIGVLLSGIILYRLHQIKNNEDRHYHRIKQYEEIMQT
ncbi:hypothetical protein C7K38_06060 [Tetragenococcus osmophilus]|uniref:PTS cellobiose transporter subunit IIA n=1 Tax=Tetragenococcus osmophilus TaxID=526944 RepID=A0AA37XJQ0_9ENTE|nr:hypothetical protein C7K38_06060 [Tetragenococcus osmophilus]GMA53681.1 hypothetical protein GCM10025857_50380 [Alicyclobacillus contaminans]GMA72388.1 hypothetical protein GCM10025885_14370 [Tetragenococcus osmophilus]